MATQSNIETWKYACFTSRDAEWQQKESVMNREEVNWLLETIKNPGDAKRFLLAQYERGRISLQLMDDVASERDCVNHTMIPPSTTAMERSAMALLLATAW
jgi:hypothetical protein